MNPDTEFPILAIPSPSPTPPQPPQARHLTPHSPFAKLASTTRPPCTASHRRLSSAPALPLPPPTTRNPNATPRRAACRTSSRSSARCCPARRAERSWAGGGGEVGCGGVGWFVGQTAVRSGVWVEVCEEGRRIGTPATSLLSSSPSSPSSSLGLWLSL